eukprot:2155038-Rhodomonas_salina.1
MTTPRTDVVLKFTKNFNKLLKTSTSQREAWAMIEKDVCNTLMDHHLEWVADAVAIFSQACQESTGSGVPLPASVQPLGASSSNATPSNLKWSTRIAARQLVLSQISPAAVAAVASPAPVAPAAAGPLPTVVLKLSMMGDPVFAPVWQLALEHSDLGNLKDRMPWERDLMLSRFNKTGTTTRRLA